MSSLTHFLSTDPDTLLDYSVTTTPDPIQASPEEGDPSKAAITIVVSNERDEDVYCDTIVFKFDIGDPDYPDASYLTDVGTGIKAMASPSKNWQISTSDDGHFEATPVTDADRLITSQGLTFTIYDIQVSKLVGTFTFTMIEVSSPGDSGFQPHTNVVKIAKFPYAFFAGDFTSDKPQVENGGTATLTWMGSEGATYTMLWDKNTQDVTDVRSWKTPPLTNTTAFILKISAQSLGETVDLYFSITVTVLHPSITATTLEVLQGTTLDGALKAKGAATFAQTLGVTGETTLGTTRTGALTTGNVATQGTLDVSSNTTLGTTIVGPLTANSLNVNGPTTLQNASATCICSTAPRGYNAMRISGTGTSQGDQAVYVAGVCNNGDGAALVCTSQSKWQTLATINEHSDTAYITGVTAQVATNKDYGLATNGKIGSFSMNAMFTHLPTRNGFQVVTSPLSLEVEIHVSGQGQLSNGKATIQFEPDVQDVIHHSDKHAYRVMLTPTDKCNGLRVAHKSANGFIVEELGGGTSNASFDWFIIARKPEELGASVAESMPEKLPEMLAPEIEQGTE